ncbi:Hypothetical predicted protein [Octopus vulgaris]|uniref:Uncharacterized protein n=1 Tax=Octopus vulgaris TaxID=6645 RepID=A0AA36B149_OCTVU|nr:Hypothetical predicted protein [Octopus vulgaris]
MTNYSILEFMVCGKLMLTEPQLLLLLLMLFTPLRIIVVVITAVPAVVADAALRIICAVGLDVMAAAVVFWLIGQPSLQASPLEWPLYLAHEFSDIFERHFPLIGDKKMASTLADDKTCK